jgi:hypothetical protein
MSKTIRETKNSLPLGDRALPAEKTIKGSAGFLGFVFAVIGMIGGADRFIGSDEGLGGGSAVDDPRTGSQYISEIDVPQAEQGDPGIPLEIVLQNEKIMVKPDFGKQRSDLELDGHTHVLDRGSKRNPGFRIEAFLNNKNRRMR